MKTIHAKMAIPRRERETLLRNRDDRGCMAAARRGIGAAQSGLGAHANPFRKAAARTGGTPHDHQCAECWEAARVIYLTTKLDQLELMLEAA